MAKHQSAMSEWPAAKLPTHFISSLSWFKNEDKPLTSSNAMYNEKIQELGVLDCFFLSLSPCSIPPVSTSNSFNRFRNPLKNCDISRKLPHDVIICCFHVRVRLRVFFFYVLCERGTGLFDSGDFLHGEMGNMKRMKQMLSFDVCFACLTGGKNQFKGNPTRYKQDVRADFEELTYATLWPAWCPLWHFPFQLSGRFLPRFTEQKKRETHSKKILICIYPEPIHLPDPVCAEGARSNSSVSHFIPSGSFYPGLKFCHNLVFLFMSVDRYIPWIHRLFYVRAALYFNTIQWAAHLAIQICGWSLVAVNCRAHTVFSRPHLTAFGGKKDKNLTARGNEKAIYPYVLIDLSTPAMENKTIWQLRVTQQSCIFFLSYFLAWGGPIFGIPYFSSSFMPFHEVPFYLDSSIFSFTIIPLFRILFIHFYSYHSNTKYLHAAFWVRLHIFYSCSKVPNLLLCSRSLKIATPKSEHRRHFRPS